MKDEELDERLRVALRAEAYRPSFVIDAERIRARLIAESPDHRRAALAWVVAGAAAAVLAVAVLGTAIVSRPGLQKQRAVHNRRWVLLFFRSENS